MFQPQFYMLEKEIRLKKSEPFAEAGLGHKTIHLNVYITTNNSMINDVIDIKTSRHGKTKLYIIIISMIQWYFIM